MEIKLSVAKVNGSYNQEEPSCSYYFIILKFFVD